MTSEKLNVEEARQGETSGHVRAMLVGGVAGAVIALAIAWAFF
ncbi:hypothetical protein [Minwuia thermotolerans]|nr:hypothetical protein [Minwuia thermotolerans]